MNDSDLIAELEAALSKGDDPEGFYTMDELSNMLGLTLEPTRKRMKKLQKAGRIERATKRVEALDGRNFPVPAYRILPAE